MIEVSYGVAILAGMLSFVSPCVLPIVPASLAFLSGETFEQIVEKKNNNIILYSIFFVFGFSTIFILLGASATFIGTILLQYSKYFTIAAGILLITIGANMTELVSLKILNKQWTPLFKNSLYHNNNRFITSYITGMAFGFGWTPCIGPILGAVLAFAASYQTVNQGVILLACYAAGLGIPFIIAAASLEKFIKNTGKLKNNLGKLRKIMGVTLIITGALFVTDKISTIAIWFSAILPESIQYTNI